MNYEYPMTKTIQNVWHRIYGWMSMALAITAGVAYYIAHSPAIIAQLSCNPFALFFIFIAQFALVIILSGYSTRMSFAAAAGSFILYSVLMGVTLSSIFLVYAGHSIYTTFLATAGTFLVMSLYGALTKTDLSAVGSLGMMGIIGLIIGTLINLFLHNQTFDFILTLVGIGLFTLLTAYDTQKINQIIAGFQQIEKPGTNIALICALILYLDFLNLFLFFLRLLGNRKASD